MKKILFLAIVTLTFFVAGFYRYQPLLILLIGELILFLFLFILSRTFRSALSASFAKRSHSIRKGEKRRIQVQVTNHGYLPVSRLLLRMHYGYTEQDWITQKLIGAAGERGVNLLEFDMVAAYCGLIEFQMDELICYDYLSLFSSKKKMSEIMQLAVFPAPKVLSLALPSMENSEPQMPQTTIGQRGEDPLEIHQLREYRDSDSMRHIHWNQSARSDSYWIKEFEKESDALVRLVLDTSDSQTLTTKEWDAFYELVSALVLGLLQNDVRVQVDRYDEKRGGFVADRIETAEQCRILLLHLYQSDGSIEASRFRALLLPRLAAWTDDYYQFNTDLEWYRNNEKIQTFSKQDYEIEIEQGVFML